MSACPPGAMGLFLFAKAIQERRMAISAAKMEQRGLAAKTGKPVEKEEEIGKKRNGKKVKRERGN